MLTLRSPASGSQAAPVCAAMATDGDQQADGAPQTRTVPGAKLGLDDAEAYKHSVDMPPCYTMRAKTAFGDASKGRMPTELAGDLSKKYDSIMMRPPIWSMQARGSGIPKPAQQPGPGEYAQPSTLYGKHPQLAVAGRVPLTTSLRKGLSDGCVDTPSPQDYEVVQTGKKFGRVDQITAPTYTMRAKCSFGDPTKGKMPTELAGDLSDKYDEILNRPPKWTMAPRGAGIPKPMNTPGPGEYAQPSTIYGSHPQLSVAGRVPKTTTARSSPGDRTGGPTPSPQDYEVVQTGKKFGRVDQATAPVFTMRAKVSFGDPNKGRMPTELAGDLSDKYDSILNRPPKWTMQPRGSGIPKTVSTPGPGEYAQPSTLYGSHPQLAVSGRVPKSSEKRFNGGGGFPKPGDVRAY